MSLCIFCQLFRYFDEFAGGATLLDRWTLQRINGLANSFEGWGGEDDDLRLRIQLTGHTLYRVDDVWKTNTLGRFYVLDHHKDTDLNDFAKYRLTCDDVNARMLIEGLHNAQYKLLSIKNEPLFTHILLDL